MAESVQVSLIPSLIAPANLRGSAAVIIDVLRASTTICQALDSGVARILPCETVEEARQLAETLSPDQRLLGGERGGTQIDGFDLDNSPRGYTPERVAGKTLVFTTTNGTRALRHAREAAHVCVGAFANLTAIVSHLSQIHRPVHLICAGTNGEITAEDVLFAGVLVDRLIQRNCDISAEVDVATEMALLFARQHGGSPDGILKTLSDSIGGRNLRRLGMEADIEFAARCDTLPVVPVWNAESGEIRLTADT